MQQNVIVTQRWAGGFLVWMVLCFVAVSVAWAGPVKKFPAEWFWGDAKQRAYQDELVGKPAPELKLSKWVNGERKPADLKGKIVVVDFWATWCGPCLKATPHTNGIYEKYLEQGVEVIGVCGSESGQELMEEVAKSYGIKYPTGQDRTLKMEEAWRVMWWPTYGVIDRRGVVRAVGLQPDFVEKAVEALLEEQPAKKAAPGSQKSR